jgi:hypothetical protein
MPSTGDKEVDRLEALMRENDEPEPQSDKEFRLVAFGEANQVPFMGNEPGTLGSVSEDYVELNIPGYLDRTPGSGAYDVNLFGNEWPLSGWWIQNRR